MERQYRTHELKILPKYFDEVAYRRKNFEIRKADRPYKEGDVLILREWENGQYTGREIQKEIGYIFRGTGEYGVAEGYCILGFTNNLQQLWERQVHVQLYDDMHEEWKTEAMSIRECLDRYTDEGCPAPEEDEMFGIKYRQEKSDGYLR